MSQHSFTLEPYDSGKSNRYPCPSCQKKREFTRYINTETGRHLHESVGSCNRKSKCGYHYTPKQYFQDNPWLKDDQYSGHEHTVKTANYPKKSGVSSGTKSIRSSPMVLKAEQPVTYMDESLLKESRSGYGNNNLVLYLRSKLGEQETARLIALYHLGTSKKWPGATVFWQIDSNGNIRSGKVMLYSKMNGKRVKKPFNHLTWVHKLLPLENFHLSQCLYGEHLLQQFPHMPVAIVESEKTALVCASLLPENLWLASGGIVNLTYEKCLVLKGRRVTLFPDLGGYENWKEKAKVLSLITEFTVSDILERVASEKQKNEGLDLADFL